MATTQMPKNLRNWTSYVDGVGYAGRVKEGTLPKIALKTFEYIGGGMVGPIDLPTGTVEKMTCDLTFEEYVPALYALIGTENVSVSFRGAQGSGSESIIVEMRGLLREVDPGTWKGGEEATLKTSFTAKYLKMTIAGSVVTEIDIENMVFKVGGTDQLSALRSALGL